MRMSFLLHLIVAVILTGAATHSVYAQSYTWNGSNNDFTNVNAWMPPGIPTGSDTATITGGTVNVNAAVTVGSLTLTGGTLTGPSSLTIVNAFNWTGGTMSGTGVTLLGAAGSFNFAGNLTLNSRPLTLGASGALQGSPANLTLQNGAALTIQSTSNLTLVDTSRFLKGTGGGTITNQGVVNKAMGTGTAVIDADFNNQGSVSVQMGKLKFASGTDTPAGSYSVVAGATLNFSNGAQTIKSGISGGGLVEFGPAGTYIVTGTYNVTGRTTIFGGEVSFPGTITSLGTLLTLDDGILDLDANNVSVPTFAQNGGELTGIGTLTVTMAMNWQGVPSVESGLGKTIVAQGATLTLSGSPELRERTLELSGSASVGGTWTFSNSANFVIKPSGQVNIGSSLDVGLDGRITNEGTITQASEAQFGTAIQVIFENNGTLDVQDGGFFIYGDAFHVAGHFACALGASIGFYGGLHSLDSMCTVSGEGLYEFNNTDVTIDGSFAPTSGVNVYAGGILTLNGPAGPLNNVYVSGHIAFGDDVTVTYIEQADGLIIVDSTLQISEEYYWVGGSLSGSGTTTISNTASLTLAAPAVVGALANRGNIVAAPPSPTLNNHTLELLGSASIADVTWEFLENASFNISVGSFVECLEGDQNILGGSINNMGVFQKSTDGQGTISSVFTNTGIVIVSTGKLDFNNDNFIQDQGATNLQDGDLGGNLIINSGSLVGSGTIFGNLDNAGSILPGQAGGPGRLNISGDFTQRQSGNMVVEIGGTNPGVTHGLVAVAGSAFLSGTLLPTYQAGYTPTATDTFVVMTYSAVDGAMIVAPTTNPALVQIPDPTGIVLQVGNPNPVITSPLTDTAVQGSFYSYFITATNSPFIFAATGLPAGLTLNPVSGEITGEPTQTGNFNVTLSATNISGTGTATLVLTVIIDLPPTIVLFEADQNPALKGSLVTITLAASDPDSTQLHYVVYFGDGTTASGVFSGAVQVTHTYTSAGDFTVFTDVHDLGTTVNGQFTQSIVAPASGAETVNNVSQGDTVTNPVDNISITVMSSAGGVIQLQVNPPPALLIRASVMNITTDFADIPGRSSSANGMQPIHQFIRRGVFVATTKATHKVTGQLMGKGRKTLVVSATETGELTVLPAPEHRHGRAVARAELPNSTNQSIVLKTMKGKFVFNGSKADTVTFSGQITLPPGVDPRVPHDFSMGIGNIVVNATVDGKGKGTEITGGNAPVLKKLKITYLKIKKGQISQGGETAKVDITFNTAGMTDAGFDTEGITSRATDVTSKTPVPRSIQVGFVLDGASFEVAAPVTFSISKNSQLGSISGRR